MIDDQRKESRSQRLLQDALRHEIRRSSWIVQGFFKAMLENSIKLYHMTPSGRIATFRIHRQVYSLHSCKLNSPVSMDATEKSVDKAQLHINAW